MAKFNFRFNSYLRVKEKIEDQKKLDYGKALAVVALEKAKKQQMEQDREDALLSFRTGLNIKINQADVQRHNNYLAYIKEAIARQQIQIEKAEAIAEEKRLELVQAMKERKTIDKVKENDYETFVFTEKKSEEKAVDGVISFKYAER